MSYQKFTVDNPICSRRFHCMFDDEATPVATTEIECPHCHVKITTKQNHPPLSLAREENLVKTSTLSRTLARECAFKDPFHHKNPS